MLLLLRDSREACLGLLALTQATFHMMSRIHAEAKRRSEPL